MTEQSTVLARRLPTAEIELTSEQLKVLQAALGLSLTGPEIQFLGEYCRRMNLDPFGREVHFWKDKGRLVAQVGIDALRKRAADTGEFEGEEIFYKAEGGEWTEMWEGDGPPFAAKAVVYRRGRRPFKVIARFDEFVKLDEDGYAKGNWASKPAHMLGVRVESHALRKAFPRETEGLYSGEFDEDPDGNDESRIHIVNPDAKASNDQITAAQLLSKELGLTDDQRHAIAGVGSFADLTKGGASILITTLKAMKAARQDPNVVDAELVEEPATQKSGPGEGHDQADTKRAPSSAGTSRPRAPDASKASKKAAQDDEDFTVFNGPHKGKTIEQVGAVDPDYLRRALEFPALPEKIRNEMRRVLAAREDVGAEEPTAEGSVAGADQPESAAPADVEVVGSDGTGGQSPRAAEAPADRNPPRDQSEPVEGPETPEARMPSGDAPSAGSDVVDGELLDDGEEDAWAGVTEWIEGIGEDERPEIPPHAYAAPEGDEFGPCVAEADSGRCDLAPENPVHRREGQLLPDAAGKAKPKKRGR